jgi:hypothetical protein
MPDVPQNHDEILKVSAERARAVAAELQRLGIDLQRHPLANELAQSEGMSTLTAAIASLQKVATLADSPAKS